MTSLPDCLEGFCDVSGQEAYLSLKTLTPLYTGGVGQRGDQLHPSGLLGSIRAFSGLVARTVGDADFEERVWGNAGSGDQANAKAKGLSIRIDTTQLKQVILPKGPIKIPKQDRTQRPSSWYFNGSCAREGTLGMSLLPLDIRQDDWNLLMIALRIQARHASFCAKDQFGLGVVEPEHLPLASPLKLDETCRGTGFSLLRCAFVDLELKAPPGQGQATLNREQRLELGLRIRAHLRAQLRPKISAGSDELDEQTWLKIRHRLMGALGESASGIDVSAAFKRGDQWCVRLFIRLWFDGDAATTKRWREMAFTRIRNALSEGLEGGWNIKTPITWQFGGKHLTNPIPWINQLAGL